MGFRKSAFIVLALVLVASVVSLLHAHGSLVGFSAHFSVLPPRTSSATTQQPSTIRSTTRRQQLVDDGSRSDSAADEALPSTAVQPQTAVMMQTQVELQRPNVPRDDSHVGMVPGSDGVHHAWNIEDYHPGPNGERPIACHGAGTNDSCVDSEAQRWFEQHILMGIMTGRHGTFRVEVSQCTWLRHFPARNVFVFTDVAPRPAHTPHHYVKCELPNGVEARDGNLFSQYLTKGYVREVRRAGQGYSLGWIIAQLRFPTALQFLANETLKRRRGDSNDGDDDNDDVRWVLLIDDDTIVNLNYLVQRVRAMDHTKPWYLSRRGWGGAGHLYSMAAMQRVHTRMNECIDKWMIRQFRASDTMLLKCGEHLKLANHLERSMSHCPASNVRERLLNVDLMTVHGKKDYYPPILLTTWRTALYYHAFFCKNRRAAEAAIFYSSCAFGNCKREGLCTKEHDRLRHKRWIEFSRNNTVTYLDFSGVL